MHCITLYLLLVCYFLVLLLNISPNIKAKKTAAAIPPAVAVSPPVNMPAIPLALLQKHTDQFKQNKNSCRGYICFYDKYFAYHTNCSTNQKHPKIIHNFLLYAIFCHIAFYNNCVTYAWNCFTLLSCRR